MSFVANHEAHPDMPVREFPAPRVMTVKELREHLSATKTSLTDYAKDCGVDYHRAVCLMNGMLKGRYGKGHEAAVLLGLKEAA